MQDVNKLRVAIAPDDTFGVEGRVREINAAIVGPDEAEALVWSAPYAAEDLRELLAGSAVRLVQVTSAGVERFHRAGCLDGKRVWASARGLYGQACAEHVLALTLSATRRIHIHARTRDNRVAQGFSAPERLLSRQHVLIVGTGGIGAASARLLKAFGAFVTGVNRSGRETEHFDRVVPVTALSDVIGAAHIVALCAPLTPATQGLFNAEMLERMHDGAWLINVARGELVETDALVSALDRGKLDGACLDVTFPDVLPKDHPLWAFDNVVITPHVATTWAMSRDLFVERVARNIQLFALGAPLEGLVDQINGY